MNKYNEVEIQTAKNLLKEGYKWIARTFHGSVGAFSYKPCKKGKCWFYPSNSAGTTGKSVTVSGKLTPLFQSIKWADNEPTYIEDIINPQILDDAERKYLSAVIRPFRKNVAGIYKIRSCNSQECRISISVSEHGCCDLPWFDDGTMYKGMREYRKYTIEELGL